MRRHVTIVGGGLAGSEAAWQCAERGVSVRLFEMRPDRPTPAHRSDRLAELVCSNSFKSLELGSAHGVMKAELRRLGSLIMECAHAARVPAGAALAVDREVFAGGVTRHIAEHPLVEVVREEVRAIPDDGPTILATGPLCSDALADELALFAGQDNLAFYDAISPIVEADSIDWNVAFRASRYGKGDGSDYVNCPMTREEYEAFHDALLAAEPAAVHDFDRDLLFEGCLPIEEMAERGRDTLRFGPMKPVGLEDPRRPGERPWAVVQLRQDNLAASHWSMVGFQTRLKWGEQKRVFRMIPGLGSAEFVKLGMIHRNTYVNAPAILAPTFQTRTRPDLLMAGQISGVEGYTESTASGLIAGLVAVALCRGAEPPVFPRETSLGALQHYVSHAATDDYQPTNFSFGLLPPLEKKVRGKRARKQMLAERASSSLEDYVSRCALLAECGPPPRAADGMRGRKQPEASMPPTPGDTG